MHTDDQSGISIYFLYKLSEQIILCSSDYKLKLWNIETEKCLKTLDIGNDNIEIKKTIIKTEII